MLDENDHRKNPIHLLDIDDRRHGWYAGFLKAKKIWNEMTEIFRCLPDDRRVHI